MSAQTEVADDRADEPADVLDSGEAGGQAIRMSGLRAVGYVLGALLTLAWLPFLFRHLGVVDFGRYVTVVALIALVGGITDAGLGAVAVREYVARRGRERDEVMRSALGARILLTGLGVVGATVFAWIAGYGAVLVLGTVLAGIAAILGVVQTMLAVPLSAELRYGWLIIGDVARAAVTVVIVLGLIAASAGVAAFLAVPIVTGIGMLALTVVLVRGRIPMRPTLDLREIAPLLRETLPLAVASVLAVLYARIVIIVMSLIATGVATGLFATASRVIEVAIGVPVVLVSTTFPILARAARDDHARLRFALSRILDVALLGGVWMALLMVVAADPILAVVGGDDAQAAAPVLRILAVGMIPLFLSLGWGSTLLALRLHRQMMIANAVALAAVVALAFALVPVLEERGAGIAYLVAESCLMVANAVVLLRAYPALRPKLQSVVPVIAATLAALAAGFLVPVPDVVGAALATVAYFGTLAALGGLPRDLLDEVLARLPHRSAGAART